MRVNNLQYLSIHLQTLNLACFRHRTDEHISRIDKNVMYLKLWTLQMQDGQANAENAATSRYSSHRARVPCVP